MAKFTKLNIGDSVASGSGRVFKKLSAESEEVQDELSGTWVFNDIVNSPLSSDIPFSSASIPVGATTRSTVYLYGFSVNFECAGVAYDEIVFNNYGKVDNWNYLFSYYLNDVKMVNAYTFFSASYSEKTQDINTWVVDTRKTINITSTLADVTNGDALLTWLKANATKQ